MKQAIAAKVADKRRAVFRAYLAAAEWSSIVGEQSGRMLDIGGAFGIHARYFRDHCPNVRVEILDVKPGLEPLVFEGDYQTFEPAEPYDFIWASHVVEHMRNPGLFFDKAYKDIREGGWIGITVPPLKSDISFLHVTLWNAGLLLVHLIHAGFDCTNAHVRTYGYNVSVIAQKRPRAGKPMPRCLPEVERKGVFFNGDIESINWASEIAPMVKYSRRDQIEEIEAGLSGDSHFFKAMDARNRERLYYFDAYTKQTCLAG